MKQQRRLARSAAATDTTTRKRSAGSGRRESDGEAPRLRAALVKVMEALEDGDVGYAYAAAILEPPIARRAVCSECGQGFEWPGLRDAHLLSAHGLEVAA